MLSYRRSPPTFHFARGDATGESLTESKDSAPLSVTVGYRSLLRNFEPTRTDEGDGFLNEGTTKAASMRFLATGMLSLGIVLPLASVPTLQNRVVALAERSQPAGVVHVSHWMQHIRIKSNPIVEHRLSILLPPTKSKVVSDGTPTIREKVLAFRRSDDSSRIQVKVISNRIIERGKPKVVISGILAYEHYAQLAKRGFEGTMRLANAALEMFATAYTADCYGCSGMTKSGVRAGFGVVAVDPRVIPLGTHLYIKGYGPAIAGDTGGAILGNRIDLGFDSSASANEFGARPVHVYILK